MKITILIFVTFFSSAIYAKGRPTCLADLREKVNHWNVSMDQEYELISEEYKLSHTKTDIPTVVTDSLGLKPGVESTLLVGSNDKAILIQHGFMASPFEIMEIAQHFNDQGYTVLAPLLEGFGGNYVVANATKVSDWRAGFKRSVESLADCFESISLVGFSLGGALVSDFVLNNEDVNKLGQYSRPTSRPTTIDQVVLLSPYFGVPLWGAKTLADALIYVDRNDSIPISKLPHQDLRIPKQFPQFYNQRMPLRSVAEILRLSKELKKLKSTSEIPTLLVISDGEKTIDLGQAKKAMERQFVNSQNVVNIYSESCDIPHQLATREGNLLLNDLLKTMGQFITASPFEVDLPNFEELDCSE